MYNELPSLQGVSLSCIDQGESEQEWRYFDRQTQQHAAWCICSWAARLHRQSPCELSCRLSSG